MQHKIHKYKLKNISSSGIALHSKKEGKRSLVWACILPSCTHYLSNIELGEGKQTLCHTCNELMELSRYEISHKIVKPTCRDCKEFKRNRKNNKGIDTNNTNDNNSNLLVVNE